MSATKGATEALWDHRETAAYLKISQSQLWAMNREGDGPPSYKIGSMRRYDPREIRTWLKAHAQPAKAAA
jgi:predicted DNA-binding transcriptional regulator AlpA